MPNISQAGKFGGGDSGKSQASPFDTRRAEKQTGDLRSKLSTIRDKLGIERIREQAADGTVNINDLVALAEAAKNGQIRKQPALSVLLEAVGARGRALAALLDALEATTGFYDPSTKTTTILPDHRVRASAAMDILSFSDGKPVERKEVVQVNVDGTQQDAQRAVMQSPSLRAALKAKLEEAERLRNKAAIPLQDPPQTPTE